MNLLTKKQFTGKALPVLLLAASLSFVSTAQNKHLGISFPG